MRTRRTLLFVPGNSPRMLQDGGVFTADSVILDLEDAVAPKEKDAARMLVAHALRYVDYGTSERIVRINPLDSGGEKDIRAVVPCWPDALLVPKVQSAADIQQVADLIATVETSDQPTISLIALIETPLGLASAYSIATAHSRVKALALGAEDYTAGIGAKRTKASQEIMYARSALVNAAAAAGVQAIDTPFTDVNDNEGLLADIELARQLGYKGKLAIHPRQVDVIHDVFNPSTSEIAWAQRVVFAVRQAESEGSGVVAVDGKMVDAPIVARAQQILQTAQLLGVARGRE